MRRQSNGSPELYKQDQDINICSNVGTGECKQINNTDEDDDFDRYLANFVPCFIAWQHIF